MKKTPRTYRQKEKTPGKNAAPKAAKNGFTLLEMLACLLVSALMLQALSGLWKESVRLSGAAATGKSLGQAFAAGQEYCRIKYATLLSEAKAQSGPEISIEDLKKEGLLDDGFAEDNAWMQGYSFHVRKRTLASGGEVLVLICLTEGGRGTDYDAGNAVLVHREAPSAARFAGEHAGYIAGENNAAGKQAGHLVSAYGTYDLSLASFGVPEPGPGHLGAWCQLDGDGTNTDVLHRVAVPGHPELNQMTVTLDMAGNNIDNIGSLKLVSFARSDAARPVQAGSQCAKEDAGRIFLDEDYGMYLCRYVQGKSTPELVLLSDSGNAASLSSATLVTDNALVKKPDCPAEAGLEPAIYVAPSIVSSGPDSPAMASFRAWASNENDTQWRIHLKVKNMDHTETSQWYSPADEGTASAPYYGSAMVLTMCAKPGQPQDQQDGQQEGMQTDEQTDEQTGQQ